MCRSINKPGGTGALPCGVPGVMKEGQVIVLGQVRRYHRALWGALLALFIAVLLSLHLTTAVSADVSVNIMNFKFDPTPLVIPVGTTVVWTNQDTAPHTATSDAGSAFTFDTGMLQK